MKALNLLFLLCSLFLCSVSLHAQSAPGTDIDWMNDACKIESGSTEIFVVVEKPPTVPSNVLKKLDNYMDTMAKEAGKSFDAKVTIMLLFPAQGGACVWGINAEGGSLTDSQIEGILSMLTLDDYKPAQQRTRKVNSRSTVTYEIEKGKVKEVKRSNLILD